MGGCVPACPEKGNKRHKGNKAVRWLEHLQPGPGEIRPAGQISVLWAQDLKSWERQIFRPVIVVSVGCTVADLTWREAHALRRGLDEAFLAVEEAKTWL